MNDREKLLEMLRRAGVPCHQEDAGDITINSPGRRYVAFEFGADWSLKRVGVWDD